MRHESDWLPALSVTRDALVLSATKILSFLMRQNCLRPVCSLVVRFVAVAGSCASCIIASAIQLEASCLLPGQCR